MTAVWISVAISAGGVVVSAIVSVFIAGFRSGRYAADINYIRRDLDEIKNLFHLTLTQPPSGKIGS